MTECPGTERLSAFIDGNLPPELRAGVVAHLNVCKTCYGVVSESLAIVEEVKNRSRARIRKRLVSAVPAGLAAAAALLLMLRVLPTADELPVPPGRQPASRESPRAITSLPKPETGPGQKPIPAAILARSFARSLASGLPESAAAVRLRLAGDKARPGTSFGFSSVMPPEKTVFRIGAALVDFEVARNAKDNEGMEAAAKTVRELLKPLEPSYGPLPFASGNRAAHASAPPEDFSSAVETLFKDSTDALYLRFGSWVQAADLAAQMQNAAFFAPPMRTDFRQELEQSGVPIGTLKNLSQLEAILESGGFQADQFKAIALLCANIKEMF